MPISHQKVVGSNTDQFAWTPVVIAADDLAASPDDWSGRKNAGAFFGYREDIRGGEGWELSGAGSTVLTASGCDHDDVCAEVPKFALNQLARRRPDGNHCGHCCDADDHAQDGKAGPHFVLCQGADGDSEGVEEGHGIRKALGIESVGWGEVV